MDEDVKDAIEQLRGELKDLGRARTPNERRESERGVQDAREDLEDVLRREGYRINRRDLDRLVDADDERKFNDRLDKALAARAAADAEEEEEEELDADGNPVKPKAKAKPKPKPKPAGATGAKPDEEEEWT